MLHSRRAFIRSTGGVLAASSAFAAESPTRQELVGMETVALTFMNAHSVPGLSVAVARDGEILYERGFGYADHVEKVTPSQLFRIASLSKPITSVTLFHLMEEQRLTLDDLVFGSRGILGDNYVLGRSKQWVEEIRVRHLLTHTAGGWSKDGEDPMFRNRAMDHRQLITWVLNNRPLENRPGEHYAYSNFGYCILGRIIEKLTGAVYEQYVRESILKRCGVTQMRLSGNTLEERAPNEVMYYGSEGQNPYNMNVHRMDSCGAWLGTAGNLAMFASHVDGHSASRNILQVGSIKEMTTPTAANPAYAKGWAVNRFGNWWHNGSLPGTTSVMVRTASGFCWAALGNSREASADTGNAMDKMMWDLVRQVATWRA